MRLDVFVVWFELIVVCAIGPCVVRRRIQPYSSQELLELLARELPLVRRAHGGPRRFAAHGPECGCGPLAPPLQLAIDLDPNASPFGGRPGSVPGAAHAPHRPQRPVVPPPPPA